MSVAKLSVMPVFGTRPEAIKMAPVIVELASQPDIKVITTVTAQHRHLLDQVLDAFSIIPAHDLDIMLPEQSLQDITERVITRLTPILRQEKPDLVLVHGDTTTTLAAALAGTYEKVQVGHVEAGLRSGDRWRPFPEEINRRLVGQLASFHFAPTERSRNNLVSEGICENSVYVTGNTAVDALLQMIDDNYQFSSPIITSLVNSNTRIMLVDLHRRESFGQTIEQMAGALLDIAYEFDDVSILVSVHPNPQVSKPLTDKLAGADRIHLVPPLAYPDWINLLNSSYLYVGDSGGLQEEAPSLNVPVVVLRDVTERPEALQAGTAILAGTSAGVIVDVCRGLLEDERLYQRMASAVNPYGDGKAARRIVGVIKYEYGLTSVQPQQFQPHTGPGHGEQ